MSTFKIGDRVHCAHYNMTGRVVDLDSRSRVDSVGEILYDVEWDGPEGSRGGWSRTDDLLTLAPPRPAPRGPKPLTRTGGKARFTVRSGHRLLPQPRVLSAMRGDGAGYTLFIRERS